MENIDPPKTELIQIVLIKTYSSEALTFFDLNPGGIWS